MPFKCIYSQYHVFCAMWNTNGILLLKSHIFVSGVNNFYLGGHYYVNQKRDISKNADTGADIIM